MPEGRTRRSVSLGSETAGSRDRQSSTTHPRLRATRASRCSRASTSYAHRPANRTDIAQEELMTRFGNYVERAGTLAAVAALAAFAHVSEAAEYFECGPGGKPNASTAKCECPAGKVEATVKGISHCVTPQVKPVSTT